MRIAFISQYFHPEIFSNTQIAQALVARGHEVVVFPCVPNYGRDGFYDGYSNRQRRDETWNGVEIRRVRTVARGRGRGILRMAANYLSYPVAASWRLWRESRKARFEVSFVSMPSPLFQAFAGVFLKKAFGTPCVYWVQDIWPESLTDALGLRSPLVTRPLAWVCGWLYRQADLVLVQSPAFPDMIARFGVPEERIRVLPNTTPDYFAPMPRAEAEAAAPIPERGAFTLMFTGNLGGSQDFGTLIEAARLLKDEAPDLRWIVIGSGREEQPIRDAVNAAGLEERMILIGARPQTDMPACLAQADAALVSLRDTPIFARTVPYKVQCYMACGVPVLSSVSGETARLIGEARAGMAVPGESPRLLADAIRRLMAMTAEERAALERNALAYYREHFAEDIVYGNLERWLHEAARGTRVEDDGGPV